MKLISEVKVERIFSLLPENIKRQTNPTDLEELDLSKDQKLTRKRFFRLKKSSIYDVHITYGYNLDEVFRNSKSFHKSYPQLSCKPIFLSGRGEIKLFGQEFFDGKPIDLVYNEGSIKEEDASQIIEEIYKILSEKIESSTKKAAREEFRNFKKNVLLNKDFKEVDRKTLTSYIFPEIERELLVKPPTIRWSTGDLSARNILVNQKQKTFKIIDCEFAYHTHFYEEDWFRLKNFSTGKFQNSEFLLEKIEDLNPLWETYLRLRQTVLNKFVHTSDSYVHYAGDDLLRSLNVFETLPSKSDEKEPLIIKAFNHTQNHYRNQLNGEQSRCEQLEEKLLKDSEKINHLEKIFEANQNNISELEINIESKTILLSKLELEKQKLLGELTSMQSQLEQEIEEKEKTIISLNNEREKAISLNKEIDLQKKAFSDKNNQLEEAKVLIQKLSIEFKSTTSKYKQASEQILNKNKELSKFLKLNGRLKKEVLSVKEKNFEKNSVITSQNATIDDIKNQLIVANDKISRMQQTFSWKMTSVLRLFRRLFIDRYRSIEHEVFDPKTYLDLNPDLKEIFGDNPDQAKRHYDMHGKKEGRSFSLKLPPPPHRRTYQEWISRYDHDLKVINALPIKEEKEGQVPLFSIIMPVYNPKIKHLKLALDSVLNQCFKSWELCIVDDASTDSNIEIVLNNYKKKHSNVHVKFNKQNEHISAASNRAISMAKGRFLVFLDHDDLLRNFSLSRLAAVINKNNEIKFIYSDEDKIDNKSIRTQPYFKPDWNPELLLSQNYICHLSCIQREIVNKVGGFRKNFEGAQDWDLFLRVTEILDKSEIFHIPEILYHWRKSPSSTSSNIKNKSYIINASKRTLEDVIIRRAINGRVTTISKELGLLRIKRTLPQDKPSVSILIPTKNKEYLLRKCIDSLLAHTDYSNYEIIILDNDSDEEQSLEYLNTINGESNIKVIKIPGKFNYSRINNLGAQYAKGEILILLNNDIEITHKEWIDELVSQAIRPEIGCVGAKLLYPNNTLQHGGVILGLGGVAGHACKHFPRDSKGPNCRLELSQNFVAVTAACLAVKKTIFEEVNGLDEKNLQVAFNDVDFCIRVHQLGYRNLWTPHAVLYHHESISRGSDETPSKIKRFQSEINFMKKRWGNQLMNDPTYNPNLTLDREDFTLAFPPRAN